MSQTAIFLPHPTFRFDRMSPRSPNPDAVIMTLAARQHGVVGRAQLLRAGITSALLDHRLRAGRLRCVHRGVYLVGPLTTPSTREMAAVLACGGHAYVSHYSAAALWRIVPRCPDGNPVDVIVAGGRSGLRPGIRARRVRTLDFDEITTLDGIPITTVARTLCDLAATMRDRVLERVVAEAFALGLVQPAEVLALARRHAARPGARRLRAILEDGAPLSRTRSEAEERFLALVRRARLAEPDSNVRIASYEVDFLWRAQRLVVEVDGRAFHGSRHRFEGDRLRDANLLAAGLRVMRVTWQQLLKEPEALVARLAQTLARPAEG